MRISSSGVAPHVFPLFATAILMHTVVRQDTSVVAARMTAPFGGCSICSTTYITDTHYIVQLDGSVALRLRV